MSFGSVPRGGPTRAGATCSTRPASRSGAGLECYAESFDTVELNASFYRLPSAEQFASWKRRTPPGFAFAVKGSRFVTHVRRLAAVEEAVQAFFSHSHELVRMAWVTL
jgi:uncharacterized protein YecE (DUF72 family)